MVLSRLTKITGPGVATDTNWVGNNADFTGITTTATSFNIGVTTIHSNLIEAHNIKSTGIITATGGSFSGNVTAVDGTFTGNVSIAGTLTYEDVTNIDSVGIITAPALDVDDFLDVGSNIKLGNAGVITATSFVGSGAALTGIDATSIKDSGGNVKIQAQASGAIHSGVSTFQDIDVDGHTNLDNVSIAGITTHSGSTTFDSNITFNGSTSNANWIKSGNKFRLNDNSKVNFGGGDNLQVYHTGTAGYITNNAGAINITGADGVTIGAGISAVGVITATSFVGSGANLTGITVPGGATNLDLLDSSGTGNGRIRLGASQDLQIYHDGSHSWFKNTTGRLLLQTDGDQIQLRGNTIVAFNGAASTEYLRITSAGRLGLGTNNPSCELHVSAANPRSRFTSTGNTVNYDIFMGTSSATVGTQSNHDLKIMTNDNERLRIASGGPHLLLGGSASVNEITESSSNSGLVIGNTSMGNGGLAIINSTSGTGRIYFGDSVGGNAARNRGQINYYHNGDYMMFATAGSERLRLTSGGQVNIGTNGALKAEINNSVGGHYFVSQCDDNQNGFEIYQQHGATNTRAPFAVYDNKTGSKDLSFKIDGAGWTYHNTTSNGTTNGNVDKRYNFGSTNNCNMAFHLTTRQRYAIWEHRQIGRTNPRTAQMSTGETPANQGTVVMYSSTANADVTGGVHLTNGATSWSGNSDMRLKNKTGDILNALEDINKIEPLKFTWKYGPDNNSHVGVSAQSVENVVPEAIDRGVDVERQREGDETEYMKVRYTELIPLSIAAIKELKAEVESLKAEIASLKSS